MKLTPAQRATLRAVAHACKHFDGLGSGGAHPRRRMEALVRLGLVELHPEPLARADGDGFTLQPERYGPGWRMTAAGTAELARLDAAEVAALPPVHVCRFPGTEIKGSRPRNKRCDLNGCRAKAVRAVAYVWGTAVVCRRHLKEECGS